MRTKSPSPASLRSSWAWSFDELRTVLPYTGCAREVSSSTVMVLSRAADTTTP